MSYKPEFVTMEPGKAIVGVKCFSCKKVITLEVKPEEYIAWSRGALVQAAFPRMPAAERELLISGTCDDCFKNMFGPEEEEEVEAEPAAQQ